jgi:anti-sigma factor RsiW
MPALLSLIIPALIPMLSDTVRGIVNRFTGGAGAQPANVAEAIQLMKAENERLEALAKLDTPSPNIAPWVANLRASCRYILAILVVAASVASTFVPGITQESSDTLVMLSGSVWSFLFGERMMIGIRKAGK